MLRLHEERLVCISNIKVNKGDYFIFNNNKECLLQFKKTNSNINFITSFNKYLIYGGGGIRTLGSFAPTHAFQAYRLE